MDGEHNHWRDSALPLWYLRRYSPGTLPVSLAVVSFFTSSFFWLIIHAHWFFFRCSSAWLHHPSALRSTILQLFICQGTRFSLFPLCEPQRYSFSFLPQSYRGPLRNKKTHSTKHMTVSFPKRLLMHLDRMRLFIGCVNLYSIGLALNRLGGKRRRHRLVLSTGLSQHALGVCTTLSVFNYLLG